MSPVGMVTAADQQGQARSPEKGTHQAKVTSKSVLEKELSKLKCGLGSES